MTNSHTLLQLIFPPRLADDESGRRTRIVYAVSFATLLGLGVLFMYRVLTGELLLWVPIVCGCITCMTVIMLARKGLVDWAASLLCWSLLSLLNYLAWTSNGITDSALLAAPGVLVCAGLVLKRRYFYTFTGTWLASIAVLGYLQLKGVIQVVVLDHLGYSDILDIMVVFGITAVTVRLLADSMISNLGRAQKNGRDLRNQADQLRESEERYRTLFEGANDAILILNEHGFVECNSMALTVFGCRDRSELIGKGPWDFSPPQQPDGSDSKDKAQLIVRDVLKGNNQRSNWKHFRKGGTIFDAEVSLSRLEQGREEFAQAIVRDVTERSAAENALRRSDERYRLLFNSIQDGVFVHGLMKDGLPGRFLEANEAACRRLGYSREELLKLSPIDIDAPDTVSSVPDAMGKVVRDGSATWEGAHIAKDGLRIPVEISNTLFTLEGKPTILATVKDITERKVVGNALRESEEKFRTIVETTSEWIWGLSKDGVHTYSNPAVESILGYRPADIIGVAASTMMHTDDWEKIGRLLPECIRERKGWRDLVVRWRHKNGSFRYLESNATPVINQRGEVIGFRGADRDITDRKQMEDRLRMSEEYYRTLVETSPDAIIIIDPNGYISFVSPRAYELFGVPPGNPAIGSSFLDWIPPQGRRAASSLLRKSLSGEMKLAALEIAALRHDQSTFWAEVSSSALMSSKGEARGLLLVCRDISARRETEQALLQAQRTESIAVLAGGIAHDFNNLLQAILGQAHLALSKLPGGSAGRGNIEKAEKAAERAAELTRQLLAYSGQGKLTMRPTDINLMVRDNKHLLESAIPRNIALELSLSEQSLYVNGDGAQIQQVLMNLVINAAEAYEGRNGSIRLKTSLRTIGGEDVGRWTRAGAEIDPGVYAEFEITDKGCGMDQETAAKVFDPFFSTKFTGRGLGLAAVLGIVRGHRGALQVESTKGIGTTFRAAFPQTEQSMQSDQRQAPESEPAFGKTVLLIDDEEVVRDVFAETLTDVGWNVLTAADGESGLRIFKDNQTHIALIVLDLSMPVMDGAETFRRLKAIDSSVKVVLSSGYGEEEAIGRFEGLGLSGFLQKPYRWNMLKETLDSYLG
ncbi:MAG: PAS domain S-box protein [Ignavibacteriales bacterium]|nr:PAS domain S-box protein [Ignavibacteriales bacterium]